MAVMGMSENAGFHTQNSICLRNLKRDTGDWPMNAMKWIQMDGMGFPIFHVPISDFIPDLPHFYLQPRIVKAVSSGCLYVGQN